MWASLDNAARTASHYLRTGDELDLQRLEASATFIADDARNIASPGETSNAIERKLGLPAICTNEPALTSIFNPGAALTT
jgi:hypothetical protein